MEEHSTVDRKEAACGRFHETIEFIGKRWTGIIVYHLLAGPRRYHELLEKIDGISDRLLTERLRELEEHGFLTKSVEKPPSRIVTYALTKKGQELEGMINEIFIWVKNNT